MTEDQNRAKKSIWKHRGRRFMTGVNVSISIFLAMILFGMVNFLAHRYCRVRYDLSWRQYYALSDKTKGLLSSIEGDVNIVVFFRITHDYYGDIKNLLQEYEYEAENHKALNLKVEFVDPDRDLAKAKELSRRYEVNDPNMIVFECEGRRKHISEKDIFAIKQIIDYEKLFAGKNTTMEKKKVAFRGEQIFSSAIQSIAQSTRPAVYFLTGHGERSIIEGEQAGYSLLTRILRRDNIEVKTLLMAESGVIPADCSAIVVAGPDRKLSQMEVDLLSGYLDNNGRVFLLIDPATTTGLEKLLENWGVKLSSGVVAGMTFTGRELVVTDFGDHPITRGLSRKNVMVAFYMPRSIEPLFPRRDEALQADKPRISVLASSTEKGWLEMDLSQNPPRFNDGIDQRGPISIAVAIEKGAVSGIDVEIKPTRLAVVGDSDFVSNGAMSSGVGGSSDFFMSVMNWLVEREALMAIAPKAPGEINLDMNRDQLRTAFLVLAFGLSQVAAVMGVAVWLFRRR